MTENQQTLISFAKQDSTYQLVSHVQPHHDKFSKAESNPTLPERVYRRVHAWHKYQHSSFIRMNPLAACLSTQLLKHLPDYLRIIIFICLSPLGCNRLLSENIRFNVIICCQCCLWLDGLTILVCLFFLFFLVVLSWVVVLFMRVSGFIQDIFYNFQNNCVHW